MTYRRIGVCKSLWFSQHSGLWFSQHSGTIGTGFCGIDENAGKYPDIVLASEVVIFCSGKRCDKSVPRNAYQCGQLVETVSTFVTRKLFPEAEPLEVPETPELLFP